ncbi:tRNA (guanosine(46)-N7)-methyltransferase TrmB [Flavobacteriales bacterium]|nr:tRNA (guanosine(46)-N7)-methyltransferase TrmB [Flavobacteriales bacterium]
MSKGKLEKFAMLADYANCVEPSMDEARLGSIPLRGKWHKDFFKNDNPLTVELACGGGEYTVGMAEMYPDRNFIGIDIKGNRIWKGATKAIEKDLTNVGFLRTRIDFIINCFAEGEVDELWITFPDPQPNKNRRRKRLTNKLFLGRYKQVLKPGGKLRLKTDSDFFYEFTREVIKEEGLELSFECDDIYVKYTPENSGTKLGKELALKTFYEKMWLEEGKTIKYIEYFLDKLTS